MDQKTAGEEVFDAIRQGTISQTTDVWPGPFYEAKAVRWADMGPEYRASYEAAALLLQKLWEAK